MGRGAVGGEGEEARDWVNGQRGDVSRERGAILFLHLSFWEPLFSRSIHHNDRSPQNSLVFPFSSPLSSLFFPYLSIFTLAFHFFFFYCKDQGLVL